MNDATERAASMSRHPAGKGNPVVYSTTTGQEPRGAASLTAEATEPLPAPTQRVRKTTTKKKQPRVKAPAKPLHTEVKVDPRVMNAARRVIKQGKYTRLTIVDAETVVVR